MERLKYWEIIADNLSNFWNWNQRCTQFTRRIRRKIREKKGRNVPWLDSCSPRAQSLAKCKSLLGDAPDQDSFKSRRAHASQSHCQHHHKRESQHDVLGCGALRRKDRM